MIIIQLTTFDELNTRIDQPRMPRWMQIRLSGEQSRRCFVLIQIIIKQLMTFNFVKYNDWSTHGTWYSPRHPRLINPCIQLIESRQLYNNHYVSMTNIVVPLYFYFSFLTKLKVINCFIIIWINTKQRRLCSPDNRICPTSAIINLIVHRK
jgi:hypothetical protein